MPHFQTVQTWATECLKGWFGCFRVVNILPAADGSKLNKQVRTEFQALQVCLNGGWEEGTVRSIALIGYSQTNPSADQDLKLQTTTDLTKAPTSRLNRTSEFWSPNWGGGILRCFDFPSQDLWSVVKFNDQTRASTGRDKHRPSFPASRTSFLFFTLLLPWDQNETQGLGLTSGQLEAYNQTSFIKSVNLNYIFFMSPPSCCPGNKNEPCGQTEDLWLIWPKDRRRVKGFKCEIWTLEWS